MSAAGEFAGNVALGGSLALTREPSPRLDPEKRLLLAIQAGDERAFATAVDRHQKSVYAYLRSRMIDPTQADDLCQDVFLRFYEGRAKLDRAESAISWLLGIARNRLREHARKLSRRKETAWTEMCLELDDCVTPATVDDHYEAIEALPKCMESLGPSARDAIDLHYRSQMRLADIGTKLSRSEGAIKLLIHRARQALRNCLERKLPTGKT
jgi:RNA polymerase sigma-70 factor (ECF subfamily)